MRPKCDFCSTPDVRWAYPARDFITRPREGFPSFASQGGWAACDVCHDLIERHQRAELAQRCAETHPDTKHVSRVQLLRSLRVLHDDFWANREGPPVPEPTT